MPSLASTTIQTCLRMAMKRDITSPDKLVKHLRRVMNLPLPSPLPKEVAVREDTIWGVSGQWLEVESPTMTILYIHGGAFIGGQLTTYYCFCGNLAKELNANVFLVDYRLAPENKFPAAVDDCFDVYRSLVSGLPEDLPFVVAGDSAGGNLTLVTLLRARDENVRMPNCAVTISPATEAGDEMPSVQANSHKDAMFSAGALKCLSKIYLDDVDPLHPYVSPGHADFSGLPPILFTVSEDELLRDHTYLAATAANRVGIRTEIISRRKMPHIWPIFLHILPEAKSDFPRLLSFIERHRHEPVEKEIVEFNVA